LNDRYVVNSFREARRQLIGIAPINQALLGTLLINANRHFHASISSELVPTLPVRIELSSSQIGDVGQVLIDLDLEIRRTASYLAVGATRPLRERGTVTLLGGSRTSSTIIFVSVSGSIYEALVAKPLDFVLAMSWFWDHRLTRTKYRALVSEDESHGTLTHITRSAQLAITAARPSVVALRIDPQGETLFEFRPL
jgi:hypothetical protein